MKSADFKSFLLKAAVMTKGCNGYIAAEEIKELQNIIAHEVYFMGYDATVLLQE